MNLFGYKNTKNNKNKVSNNYPHIQYSVQSQGMQNQISVESGENLIDNRQGNNYPNNYNNPNNQLPIIGVPVNAQVNNVIPVTPMTMLPQIQPVGYQPTGLYQPYVPNQPDQLNQPIQTLQPYTQLPNQANQYQQSNQENQHSLPDINLSNSKNDTVLIDIENPDKVETSQTNNLLPITPRDTPIPSAPPFNAVMGKVVSYSKNDKYMEPHYQEIKLIQDAIKYQLEHYLLKNPPIYADNSHTNGNNSNTNDDNITININNMTTLEFKKITEVGKVIYLLKILVTTNLDRS